MDNFSCDAVTDGKPFSVIFTQQMTFQEYFRTVSVFDEINSGLESVPNESKPNIFPTSLNFKDLEERIAAFEKIKKPVLKLPKLNKKRKRHVGRSLNRNDNKSPQRKINIPLSLRPTPMPEFKLPSIDNSNLGPGSYFSPIRDKLPGVHFSKQSRFSDNFEDIINNFMKKRQHSENNEICQVIEKRNKRLEQFLPENKEKYIKEKVKERDLKIKIHQRAKEILGEFEKKSKEERYLEKVNKHE